jgi:UDP-glucose 6-dehydrogenase
MTETQLQSIITQVEEVIKYAENNQLTNTQEFINFLDKLNELSVSH